MHTGDGIWDPLIQDWHLAGVNDKHPHRARVNINIFFNKVLSHNTAEQSVVYISIAV